MSYVAVLAVHSYTPLVMYKRFHYKEQPKYVGAYCVGKQYVCVVFNKEFLINTTWIKSSCNLGTSVIEKGTQTFVLPDHVDG